MNKAVKPRQLDIVEQLDHLDDLDGPTPTQKRKMLIAGAEDFDKHFPPPTAEEAVDNYVAKSHGTHFEHEAKQPDDDFDWNDDPSVVLQAQPATAIYRNPFGHLVIRQERKWNEEEDPIVIIAPESAFMEALAAKARE